MPEASEVKHTAIFLDAQLKNETITDMKIFDVNLLKKWEQLKCPCVVREVKSKGKWIYIITDSCVIFHHLNMSGNWSLGRSDLTRATLTLDNKKLYLDDSRGWSVFNIKTLKEMEDHMKILGPNIIDYPPINILFERIKKKKRCRIDSALMEQDIIAGIGNYMKSEILYRSGIDPLRLIKTLSDDEWNKLYNASIAVTKESFESKGVSIKDYVGGEYQKKLKVYGKKGQLCEKNHEIKSYVGSKNRMTFWCPECQK